MLLLLLLLLLLLVVVVVVVVDEQFKCLQTRSSGKRGLCILTLVDNN